MKNNVTFGIGNVAVIDKVNEKFKLFDYLFSNLNTKANKSKIRKLGFHYLTLKAKKRKT